MQRSKPFSLSDLIRNKDCNFDSTGALPDPDEEYVKEYGIGIDCHSRFIEVCVRYRSGDLIRKAQGRFDTDWDSLVVAKDWRKEILETKADPVPDLSLPFHYLI